MQKKRKRQTTNMKHYNRRPQRQKEWGRKPKKPSGIPPFDVLMRRFKKKVERDGIIAEVRERRYYENLLQKDRRKRMQRNEESTLINYVQNKH